MNKYKIIGGISKLKCNPSNSPVWNNLIKIKEEDCNWKWERHKFLKRPMVWGLLFEE
jgi:hypothetical protein